MNDSFRRTRSLYYQKIFRTMMEAMRIERIEGFQPYDQFVEHRLVRSYSVLKAISKRHQLVSAREGELRRKLLTAKSVVYQEKLTGFQRRAADPRKGYSVSKVGVAERSPAP